ncbi:MAG: hypothetical protein ACI4WT_11840 [Oligosphaeraceae bacterium]
MFDFNSADRRYTHMPFVAHDADGSPQEFCCISVNGLWKLHWRRGRKWRRIRTGLPEDATECSPTAEWEDKMWKVSFVAGGWKGDRRFRLYRMYGLDTPPMAQGFADIGFVRKDTVAMAGRRGPIVIREAERTVTLDIPEAMFLYRLSYDPQRPNRLLISGETHGGGLFSWSYVPGMGELLAMTDGGTPAYKCALWDGVCHYAQRIAGFEERRIVQAEHLELTPLDARKHIVETIEYGSGANAPKEFE